MPRANANVFTAYKRKKGLSSSKSEPNLAAYRALFLGKHGNWTTSFRYQDRLRSLRLRQTKHPDWELYRAAELSMILVGRKTPEPLDRRPWYLDNYLAMDLEAVSLLRWLRNEVENNIREKRGLKPDPVKLYKTALSTLVAKKLVWPNGGNSKAFPSPREIAQVYYVLFEEEESDQAIRSRMRRTGKFCIQFQKDTISFSPSRQPRYFGPLGRAIVSKYP